jgi:hypothetical protein
MKFKIILLIAVLSIIGCHAKMIVEETKEIEIILENNTTETKIYRVKWLNHPYGCSMTYYGFLKCDHAIAVGELKAGKENRIIIKGLHIKIGNKYKITWESTDSYVRQNEKIIEDDFIIEENTKKIHSKVQKEKQGV